MNERISSELNKVCASVGLNARVFFHATDTVSVIKSVAPFSKVAVLYAKNTFSEKGKDFTAQLKAANVTPLNFILPEGVALSPKNVFDIIGVPDDVRAVVYFDSVLSDIAAYLATIFNIPVIRTLISVNTENLIGVRLPFFWNDKTDFFDANCIYHIVINVKLQSGNLAEQYIYVLGQLPALTDYRVKLKVCGGAPAKSAYDLVKSAVVSVLTLDKNPEETLIIAGLKIELANLLSDGEIIGNSAGYAFKRLNRFNLSCGVAFSFFEKQMRLYALSVAEYEMPFVVPDYNARASELANLTATDDGAFLLGLKKQTDVKKKIDLAEIKSEFKTELMSQASALGTIEQRYAAFGGKKCKDFSPYISAFKHSGDLPETFNFMTVLRELGFIEFF